MVGKTSRKTLNMFWVSLAAYVLKKTVLILRATKLMSLGYKEHLFTFCRLIIHTDFCCTFFLFFPYAYSEIAC